jgi:hypothetical protein
MLPARGLPWIGSHPSRAFPLPGARSTGFHGQPSPLTVRLSLRTSMRHPASPVASRRRGLVFLRSCYHGAPPSGPPRHTPNFSLHDVHRRRLRNSAALPFLDLARVTSGRRPIGTVARLPREAQLRGALAAEQADEPGVSCGIGAIGGVGPGRIVIAAVGAACGAPAKSRTTFGPRA